MLLVCGELCDPETPTFQKTPMVLVASDEWRGRSIPLQWPCYWYINPACCVLLPDK